MRRTRTKLVKGDPKRAVAYVRVSTEEQALGPEAQLDMIRRWAAACGVEVVATFEDRLSGGSQPHERPGLQAALAALREQGAGVFVVAKRDRIARDTLITGTLERLIVQSGAALLSASGEGTDDDGPSGLMMRGIVDVFAQYERAMIQARTKSALGVLKRRGQRVGSVPFGFVVDAEKHLHHDPGEQAALARMRELRDGGASYPAIARALEHEGHACRGARWHATTVWRALRAETS